MKLRKKQIKLPKNFSVPRWIFANPSKEKSDFLKGVVSESSECARVPRTNHDLSGRRGRVTVVGTHDLCVRPRQNHDAVTFDTTVTVTFDTTDAQIIRPYCGLLVGVVRSLGIDTFWEMSHFFSIFAAVSYTHLRAHET